MIRDSKNTLRFSWWKSKANRKCITQCFCAVKEYYHPFSCAHIDLPVETVSVDSKCFFDLPGATKDKNQAGKNFALPFSKMIVWDPCKAKATLKFRLSVVRWCWSPLSVCCHVKQLLVYRCLHKERYWPAGLSLINMDWVLTLPEVFLCYSFFLRFDDVFFFFLLNYSIKLTRNLWVGLGFLLLTCQKLLHLSHRSSACLFPPLLGIGAGGVRPFLFPQPILILTSDFTRSTARVTVIAAKPGMLLEHIQHVVGLLLELC